MVKFLSCFCFNNEKDDVCKAVAKGLEDISVNLKEILQRIERQTTILSNIDDDRCGTIIERRSLSDFQRPQLSKSPLYRTSLSTPQTPLFVTNF